MIDWSLDFEDEKAKPQDWSEDFGDKPVPVKQSSFRDRLEEIPTAEWQAKNIAHGVMAVKGLSDSVKKGLIKGSTEMVGFGLDLLGLGARGGEMVGEAFNRVSLPPSQRGIEVTPHTKRTLREQGKEPPERYTSEYSDIMSTGVEQAADLVRDYGDKLTKLSVGDFEPETVPERVVERISEYAPQGAAFTQGLISVGKKHIKGGLENPTLLQKLTIDIAKDPAKAHKIEQAMSAVAASVGQGAEEMGASPGYQFLAEVVGTVTAGGMYNAYKKFASSELISRWLNKTKHAETDVGEFLDAIFKEDPNIMDTIEEGKKLSDKYGVEMNLGELAENPELQAAGYAIESGDTGGLTALRERARGQAASVNEMFQQPTGQVETAQDALIAQADEQVTQLKSAVMDANEAAIDEATNLGGLKGVEVEDVGQAVLNRIDAAEDLARAELQPLYDGINLAQKTGSTKITKAINDARRSLLPKNEFKGELESHLKSIFNAVTGKDAAPKTYGTVKPFTLNRDAKDFEFTVGSIQEIQGQLKRVIREERSKGNNELVMSLTQVLGSTYDQLDSVGGQNVDRLKVANAKAREVFERFNDTRIRTITKTDIQGDMKVAPEDIVSTLVRSNNEKGSIEAVTAYKDAIKDNRLANDQLFNAFAIKLRGFATVSKTIRDADGSERVINVLDKKKVQSFMDKHSNFMRASNIAIKNPDAMARKAQFAQETLDMTMKEMSRDSLMKWANTEKPVEYVMSALKNNQLKGMMNRADELTKRGIREALWDGLFESTITSRSLSAGGASVTVDKVKMLVAKKGDDLEQALSKKHFNAVKDIIRIVDRISVSGGKAGAIAAKDIDQHLVEKMLTGLRAAAHGFVRPDLIIAQATARAAKAMNTVESQNVLREALNNPEFAIKLMEAARDVRTRPVVYTLFTPLLASSINLQQETEFND